MIAAHLRHNVVAYLALAVALSTGTAYAADRLAPGSVTTQALAKNSVTSPKIKKAAVRSADVKNRSLRAVDVAPGVLPAITAEAEGQTPGATPDAPDNRTRTFTSAGGRTYIQFAYNRVGVTCSAGSGRLGLYLDGVPVPDTSFVVPGHLDARHVATAAVLDVSPGQHTASIGLDCQSGSLSNGNHTDSMWLVLTPQP